MQIETHQMYCNIKKTKLLKCQILHLENYCEAL